MNDAMLNKIDNSVTELNLSGLFWHVLSKWRALLACGLILGILLGGVSAAGSFSRLSDENYIRSVEEANRKNAQTYEISRKNWENQIMRYESLMAQQEEYGQHAALLALDPYNVYVCEGLYFVDAEAGNGDADYTPAIVAAYSAELGGLDEKAALEDAGQLLPAAELDNYDGFLTVSADLDSSILSYKIYGVSEAQADALSDAMKATVRSSMAGIASVIRPHKITLISEKTALGKDDELALIHSGYYDLLSSASNNLSNAISSLEKLSPPETTSLSRMAALRASVKKGVIGFAAGAFLCALFYAVIFAAKGPLADPEEAADRFGMEVLGVIPSGKRRKGFDAWIAGHFGLPAGMSTEDGLSFSCVNLEEALKGCGHALLTGSGDAAVTEALHAKLAERMPGLQLRSVGNIFQNAEARKAFNESDAVVFVETLQESRKADLRRELLRTHSSGKRCLGLLLVEKSGK